MSDKAVTHHFKDCTFDLRGADYACVSRGDEFEIGHTGEGDRVLIEGDTLDFTGLHILGPVALADRIKAAVALECYAMATERDALRAEIARLTAERDAALAGAVKVKPLVWEDAAEMLAKEMQAIVAADRWKGRDLSYTPPEKWSHLRPETQKFWIDTAARILASIQPAPEVRQEALAKAWTMGRDSAAETCWSAKDESDYRYWGGDANAHAVRINLTGKQRSIRALTPPADLAAKIGGE